MDNWVLWFPSFDEIWLTWVLKSFSFLPFRSKFHIILLLLVIYLWWVCVCVLGGGGMYVSVLQYLFLEYCVHRVIILFTLMFLGLK